MCERGRERDQEREAMSIYEMVKTQKQYYLCNMRSAHFPIDSSLHRERAREREAMFICEMLETEKWYYFCNPRSAYFPINSSLHREREEERESKRERDYVHL